MTMAEDTDQQQPKGKAGRGKRKAQSNQEASNWFDLKVNSNVYISGLPDDVTQEELITHFSKCGVIKLDAETSTFIGFLFY